MYLLLLMILLHLVFVEHHHSSVLLLVTRCDIFPQIWGLHDMLCLGCLALDRLTFLHQGCCSFCLLLLGRTLCLLCLLLLWFDLLLNILENKLLDIRILWIECHLLGIVVIQIDVDVDISMVYQNGLVFICFASYVFDLSWMGAVSVLRLKIRFIMVDLASFLSIVYRFHVAWFVSKGDELHQMLLVLFILINWIRNLTGLLRFLVIIISQ